MSAIGTRDTSADAQSIVSLADVQRAADRLAGQVVRTPIVEAVQLSARTGARIGVKAESLQRTGSFKFRGAFNYIATLGADDRARGVIAPSSGNHGQAVACVAQIFGIPATVVMPTTVTAFKREGVESYGATSVLAGTTTDDRMAAAEELARSSGATIVPPYDDLRIIAGQGTCGLEILADRPGVTTVLVPVGGGGLCAGISTVVKSLRASVRVIAVEPAGAPKLTAARNAGTPTSLERSDSAADGLLAIRIGTRNFAHLSQFVDEVVTVSEDEIRDATRYIVRELKLVAEPSGATTLAALLSGRASDVGDAVAVLSGGNISLEALQRFCA